MGLLIAIILRIISLPQEFFLYNPDWVLLFLIYWAMAIPERVGVGYAWCTGLLTDALTGRMLGQHALAYAVVSYLCVRMHQRLRLYPFSQQSFSVLMFLLLSQLLIFWTQSIKAVNAIGLVYWLPSLVGALIWPAVLVTLRRVRRRYNIF
ncbi:MAG: rod shape-determining protein MreD [Methylococcaceae bacterium]|nr:rod shape-determining protein MreD [Methylococcaceae bacterium]